MNIAHKVYTNGHYANNFGFISRYGVTDVHNLIVTKRHLHCDI